MDSTGDRPGGRARAFGKSPAQAREESGRVAHRVGKREQRKADRSTVDDRPTTTKATYQ